MFTPYNKIQSPYKRDTKGKMIHGEFSRDYIEFLADKPWHWTEKVDGTNIRIGIDNERKFRLGGRTDRASIPTHLLQALMELDLEERLNEVSPDAPITIYGEGYGPKIQRGDKYRKTPGFVVFDIQIDGWWLNRKNLLQITNELGLEPVPLVFVDTFYAACNIVGNGLFSVWGDFYAEGVVGTPAVPLFARDGTRIMTKIKYKDFKND